jgi:hypothetical protein
MDLDRFDALIRSLTTAGSRRRAIVAAVGGTLGLLRAGPPDDGLAGGRCKPACGACHACKKGKCKKTKHGKKCKKGKCRPQADGTACANGNNCQGGICTCTFPSEECPTGCTCHLVGGGGTPICMEDTTTNAPSCDDCPEGTVRCDPIGPMLVFCNRACGT